MIEITPEVSADEAGIERLLDQAFGPERHSKRSYAYRTGIERVWRLCMAAREGERLIGTIRYWPVRIGEGGDVLLLGPIAVDPAYRAFGLGAALMRLSLGLAAAGGHRLVVLVGDEPYYRRFGFVPASDFGITMENENPDRLLLRWLGAVPQVFPGGPILRSRTEVSAAA